MSTLDSKLERPQPSSHTRAAASLEQLNKRYGLKTFIGSPDDPAVIWIEAPSRREKWIRVRRHFFELVTG